MAHPGPCFLTARSLLSDAPGVPDCTCPDPATGCSSNPHCPFCLDRFVLKGSTRSRPRALGASLSARLSVNGVRAGCAVRVSRDQRAPRRGHRRDGRCVGMPGLSCGSVQNYEMTMANTNRVAVTNMHVKARIPKRTSIVSGSTALRSGPPDECRCQSRIPSEPPVSWTSSDPIGRRVRSSRLKARAARNGGRDKVHAEVAPLAREPLRTVDPVFACCRVRSREVRRSRGSLALCRWRLAWRHSDDGRRRGAGAVVYRLRRVGLSTCSP